MNLIGRFSDSLSTGFSVAALMSIIQSDWTISDWVLKISYLLLAAGSAIIAELIKQRGDSSND